MTTTITLDDIKKDVVTDSHIHHYGFGTLGTVPHIKPHSDLMKKECDNEVCVGKQVEFNHYISEDGDCLSKYDSVDFSIEGRNLDNFKISGVYCPICERLEILVNGEVMREREGMNIV